MLQTIVKCVYMATFFVKFTAFFTYAPVMVFNATFSYIVKMSFLVEENGSTRRKLCHIMMYRVH